MGPGATRRPRHGVQATASHPPACHPRRRHTADIRRDRPPLERRLRALLSGERRRGRRGQPADVRGAAGRCGCDLRCRPARPRPQLVARRAATGVADCRARFLAPDGPPRRLLPLSGRSRACAPLAVPSSRRGSVPRGAGRGSWNDALQPRVRACRHGSISTRKPWTISRTPLPATGISGPTSPATPTSPASASGAGWRRWPDDPRQPVQSRASCRATCSRIPPPAK